LDIFPTIGNDPLVNDVPKEKVYFFYSGYYYDGQGTKIYNPANGVYYQESGGAMRHWLTNVIDSRTFLPSSRRNNTVQGYYFRLRESSDSQPFPVYVPGQLLPSHTKKFYMTLVYFEPDDGSPMTTNVRGTTTEWNDCVEIQVTYTADSTSVYRKSSAQGRINNPSITTYVASMSVDDILNA
jgi:hypothetical protein